MIDPAVEASPRVWAGVCYLITIVMGVFAEVFVRGELVVRDDAAATAANILSHETLYRLGLAADPVILAAYVAVTLVLYVLLKPVGRILSLLAAFFSLIGIAVLRSAARVTSSAASCSSSRPRCQRVFPISPSSAESASCRSRSGSW